MAEFAASIVRIILAMMLMGGISEYAPPSWDLLQMFAILMLLTFVVTLFHELGHAMAVWRQRGTVTMISVFGLTYQPRRRRFSLRALPRGGDLAGFVQYSSPARGWTRRQHAMVAAAGPLADAAIALLALGAAALLSAPSPSFPPAPAVVASGRLPSEPARLPDAEAFERIIAHEPDSDMVPFASMLMVVAFVSALGNLLPYRGSDGARLLELWRGRNRVPRTKKG